MTRTTALIALALLALCAFASAAQQDDATTATRKGYKHKHHTSGDKEYSYDDDDSSYKKHEHKYHSHDSYDDGSSYKKKDDYEYKENDYSPSYKSYGDGYSGGYYYSPNGWHEGEDHNKAWYHIEKHRGDCMANRRVRVTGSGTDGQPLNLATGCPPNAPGNLLNPPAGATPVVPCNTPAFCGDPNSIPVGCGCLTENGPSAGSYPDYVRYELDNVAQHFWSQPAPKMVDARKHTWECVDARGQHPMLGTAGGDLAEAMAAAAAVMKVKGVTFDESISKGVFKVFSEDVANPERPLYFHTDDTRLRQLFITLRNLSPPLNENADIADPKRRTFPSAFPDRGPDSPTDRATWLDYLSRAKFNGCGHVREMLQDDTKIYYSVDLDAKSGTACTASTDPDRCIDAKAVAVSMIKQFFSFWWFTPSGSWQRRYVAFEKEDVVIGPLEGKAVAIIQKDPKTSCKHEAPLIVPNYAASQIFVYHGDAVAEWREYVTNKYLVKYLRKINVDPAAVLAAWNAIAGQQLGATLAYLNPANKVGQWLVDVPVKPYEPATYGDSYKY